MEREYYSLPEAAALLGISRIAVFKRVRKGRLPAMRFGRNWAVPASALAAAGKGTQPVVQPRGTAAVRQGASTERRSALPPAAPDEEMDSIGWD